MSSRRDLSLEEKINLTKEKDRGLQTRVIENDEIFSQTVNEQD